VGPCALGGLLWVVIVWLTTFFFFFFCIAPEVYKGGGYNEAVDWWGLGVTLYECVYGKVRKTTMTIKVSNQLITDAPIETLRV
jgi:hypothetical protein